MPRSSVSGVGWPAVPDGEAATLLALQHQLELTERLSPEELRALQMEALSRLLRHARSSVPYYRDDPAYGVADDATLPLTTEAWATLPVLQRAQVQEAGTTLITTSLPAEHTPLGQISTSGSTGRPLTVVRTRITHLFWLAITLREHLWHGRDATATMVAIRPGRGAVPAEGVLRRGWGPPIDTVCGVGLCAIIPVETDVVRQARCLVAHQPAYLLSLPSNVMALADHFRSAGERLSELREVITLGEPVSDVLREACRDTWDVPVTDMYSSQEIGYIALQCQAGERYHIQSEVVYAEVLDDDDQPCRAGEVGRVVVTALHNHAQPLIRYDTGDFAEVGEPCPCGRGLPVLARIAGRERNMVTLPTGERFWPTFSSACKGIDAIRQLQLVQVRLDHIRARVVGPRPLSGAEEASFTAELRRRLRYPFEVSFEYLSGIDRSESLKFEDFVSLVERPAYDQHPVVEGERV